MVMSKPASLSASARRVLGWSLLAAISGLILAATGLAATGPPLNAQAAAGLPWPWLAFGFGAQLAFSARFLVQWIASERARASIMPTSFWLLSLLGGAALFAYFWRRGDPVGMAGQAVGVFVYARNLALIGRQETDREASEKP